WRAQGLSDVEIGRRLGVSDKTAARVLTDHADYRESHILSVSAHPRRPKRGRWPAGSAWPDQYPGRC
ncbi:MAG TPA: hypothetical protein VNS49_11840, partial [Streptomyces sp.]|nr:hypothetical protein [Streptomyces sp.]